jgi:hypothetical protein
LLDRFVARDVPLTTASDAHHLDHVADRADDLRAVLASAGAGSLQAYRRRVGHAVPVTPVTPAPTPEAEPVPDGGHA